MGEKEKKSDKPQEHTAIPTWANFVIGGSSGMMSICIVQPADLVKTRMQLLGMTDKSLSTLGVVKQIISTEGIRGFYRGLSAALFRQGTYTTGRMGVFHTIFDYYKRNYGSPIYPVRVLMGLISGGIGAFIGTPAEVALIRMTSDGRLPPEKRRNYKNVFNALGRVAREEGILKLWSGASVTMARAMVVNGAQLATYSQARDWLFPYVGEGIQLHICSAVISAFVTSTVSLPVDIVKTRVQSTGHTGGQLKLVGTIIKNEGITALWTGFLPTYARLGPHTVFTFFFIEQLTKLYLKMANS